MRSKLIGNAFRTASAFVQHAWEFLEKCHAVSTFLRRNALRRFGSFLHDQHFKHETTVDRVCLVVAPSYDEW